jgi:hypothetical protein
MDFFLLWVLKPIGEFFGIVLIFVLLAIIGAVFYLGYMLLEHFGFTRNAKQMEKILIRYLGCYQGDAVDEFNTRHALCGWNREREKLFDVTVTRLIRKGIVAKDEKTIRLVKKN